MRDSRSGIPGGRVSEMSFAIGGIVHALPFITNLVMSPPFLSKYSLVMTLYSVAPRDHTSASTE